jgi:hypothetical protein
MHGETVKNDKYIDLEILRSTAEKFPRQDDDALGIPAPLA